MIVEVIGEVVMPLLLSNIIDNEIVGGRGISYNSNGYIEETVTGQKVIKVFFHEETTMEEFEFLSDDLRKKQMKAQFFDGIMGPIMGNLSQICYAIFATVGGVLCLTTNFDVGVLTIFTNYSRQFSKPINELF